MKLDSAALGYETRADGAGTVLIRNAALVGHITRDRKNHQYRAATVRGAYGRFHTMTAAVQFLIDNDFERK